MFLFVYLFEDPMTYMGFYATLLFPILSFFLALVSKRRFVVKDRLTANFIAKGQEVSYIITVKNDYFWPCTLVKIQFEGDEAGLVFTEKEKFFSISSYGRRDLEFIISGKYRGSYEIGIKEIIIYDFLGLFKFKQKHDLRSILTITPRITPIIGIPLESVSQDEIISKNHMQGEDYSVISELRKYQPTDGYKKVHWKASAKRNELISKNYQEAERCVATFYVNNIMRESSKEEDLALEDKMMEGVVSVMYYCYRLGHPISLHYVGGAPMEFTTDFPYVYKEASGLPFKNEGNFRHILEDYLKTSKEPMNVIVFSHRINERLVSTLQLLKMEGDNIVLFMFSPKKNEEIRKIELMGIKFVSFDDIVSPVSYH
jgi:uncharacterized protein (DUF58 family)